MTGFGKETQGLSVQYTLGTQFKTILHMHESAESEKSVLEN